MYHGEEAQLLSRTAFFAQETRFKSHVRELTVEAIQRDYHCGVPLGPLLDSLVSMALPATPNEEVLMRELGVDVHAYVNDNLLVVINKLWHALHAIRRHIPALDRLMQGMWALYIDTMTHPFEHTQAYTPNKARAGALNSFRLTLWHALLDIGAARSTISADTRDIKRYSASFLNTMLHFARSVFESRAFYEPLPINTPVVGQSLWDAYLCLWDIPLSYE